MLQVNERIGSSENKQFYLSGLLLRKLKITKINADFFLTLNCENLNLPKLPRIQFINLPVTFGVYLSVCEVLLSTELLYIEADLSQTAHPEMVNQSFR